MGFYFPYMETNRRLIWIVMAPSRQCKFHAPSTSSAVHKLLTYNNKISSLDVVQKVKMKTQAAKIFMQTRLNHLQMLYKYDLK